MTDMQQPTSREQRLTRLVSTAVAASGIGDEALASRLGMNTATLRRHLADVGSFSYPDFRALAVALGTSASALIAESRVGP